VNHLLSVLIPAHNEADYIASCLAALFASEPLPADVNVEVLVLANGCTDETANRARACTPPPGWALHVLELAKGDKLAALNQGDAQALGDMLVYLDADVTVDPALLPQIALSLHRVTGPAYRGGSPRVAAAQSIVTRAYARVWQNLPFVQEGVPGFGVFAMNRAGRQRWEHWPAIISDDTFARLQFTPQERQRLSAGYTWPMVEGFRNLVRVRRRQDQGVAEISRRFPDLLRNDDKNPVTLPRLLRIAGRHPVGLLVYLAVAVAVRSPLFSNRSNWERGR
jgi:glycosyltransferase involved in cell wall biosynthesis